MERVEQQLEDDALMQMIQEGGAKAEEGLAELQKRHKQTVVREALCKIGAAAPAEDLAAEVFRRVWLYSATYEPQGKFESWLRTVSHRVACDWLRGQGRRVNEEHISGALLPRGAVEVPPDLRAIQNAADAKQYGKLSLLREAVAVTQRALRPNRVERWRRGAVPEAAKNAQARVLNISEQEFHRSQAHVEAATMAGVFVHALLLGGAQKGAQALLSDYTLVSPALYERYAAGDLTSRVDRQPGVAFWSAACTRALDQMCGLAPVVSGRPKESWVPLPDALVIGDGLKELILAAAEDLCRVLQDRRQSGTAVAARKIIRDGAFLFGAARVLGTHGRDALDEAVSGLKEAGVLGIPYLRRQVPVAQAYVGIEGGLAEYYARVEDGGQECALDTAVLATYLAAPRADDTFAKALVWGEQRDVAHVLAWARRNWRMVDARWVSYIAYCLENPTYDRVPDLLRMVASWPVQLVRVIGTDERLRSQLEASVSKFLDECPDRNLKASAEKVLLVLRQQAIIQPQHEHVQLGA